MVAVQSTGKASKEEEKKKRRRKITLTNLIGKVRSFFFLGGRGVCVSVEFYLFQLNLGNIKSLISY